MIRYQRPATLLHQSSVQCYRCAQPKRPVSVPTSCCYVGVQRKREGEGGERRERERESGERRNGGAKRARSLRGSVGNSGRRRVVNFRLHRRAASRLPPWSTFLFFFLLAPFLRPWNVLPHALPSYSSRAYDSASLRLNAYADCRQ